MKHLPAQPPEPIPGVVIQGGRAGPFTRNGRLPVDPRRARQVLCRGALGWTSKQWNSLSSEDQDIWRALSASGTDGQPKMSGRAVVSRLAGPLPDPAPPVSDVPPAPVLASVAFSSPNVLLMLGADIASGVTLHGFAARWQNQGAADPNLFVFLGAIAGPFTSGDVAAFNYVAQYGAPPVGQVIWALCSVNVQGVQSPPSAQLNTVVA